MKRHLLNRVVAEKNWICRRREASKAEVEVRESIDGRRLNGAGYLIEVVGL